VPLIDIYQKFREIDRLSHLESNPEYSEDLAFYKRMLGEKALNENKKLLLTTDGSHPNRIGHKIIAEEIYFCIMDLISEGKIIGTRMKNKEMKK